jgi:MtfA peptidase
MITVLQIAVVLFLIILLALFVFKPKRAESFPLPENYQQLLNDYVKFYFRLDEADKRKFEDRFQKFLTSVNIVGANAEIEDLDRILIGAGAIIPVFHIPDWEYINLREVLVYPGNFNHDFDQHGMDRSISGMVGTGALQNVMIISKWELRQGFINANDNRNTAIHEFVHLVDKMDGTTDGIPEILLERKYIPQWKDLVTEEIERIKRGASDIDFYGATNPAEFFAVIAEYFFEQPELFKERHPELNELMEKIFIRKTR